MGSDTTISVRNLSKCYKLAPNAEKHSTLAEAVLDRLRHPFRREAREEFWALTDVNFDISNGDVVGIIGRNGAGKSTLLKILSRITDPTRGEVKLYGRVGSLLEVGTGFHPELTGRENIYLNGQILGMRKREVDAQFDAIVDFAGVEKFLATPVKRYSSGMYVRLAFAVAAHLNPEILVIDEVLAVGDSEFQKKCLGKMKDVASSGRTVLFVSHNMAAVSNLCTSSIVMSGGRMVFQGPTAQGIDRYVNMGGREPGSLPDLGRCRPPWAKPYITAARVLDGTGRERQILTMGSEISVELTFQAPAGSKIRRPVMGLVFNHATLGTVGGVNTRMTGFDPGGTYESGTIRCRLPEIPLLQGTYSVDLWFGDGPEDLDSLTGYLTLELEPADIYGSGQTPFAQLGAIYLRPRWEIASGSDQSAVAGTVAPGTPVVLSQSN